MKTADIVVVAYAINDKKSFTGASGLVDKLRRIKDAVTPLMIVGMKCDLEAERQVTTEEGAEFAKSTGSDTLFFETSGEHL